jgi:WhiB family transcriptional regulator, redox-sensing transcriptional regulator
MPLHFPSRDTARGTSPAARGSTARARSFQTSSRSVGRGDTAADVTDVAVSVARPSDPDSTTAWMSGGNCRNYPPAVFFPSDGVGVDRARKICTDCPVLDRCLEYALEQRIEHGVWGGCSERERRRILKRRRVASAT